MFDFDAGLPSEIVPLSWLLGIWEGTGIIAYALGDDTIEHEFRQRVAFTHDGTAHLQYTSSIWLLDAEAADGEGAPSSTTPLFSEIGYWRLSRPLGPADQGPGMLPASASSSSPRPRLSRRCATPAVRSTSRWRSCIRVG